MLAVLVLASTAVATPAQPLAKTRLIAALGAARRDLVLASPVTGAPLLRERSVLGRSVQLAYREEGAGGRIYRDNGAYVDLTPPGAELTPEQLLGSLWAAASELVQPEQFGQSLFRNPAISWVYERGWRQNFNANGFPGIDKEFEEVQAFFAPVAAGGAVLDMSCGSGLMTRRLAASGAYGRVIAADYSESMLTETARRFREERMPVPDLVRCDVAALPMQSASLSAAHAGAALHCWPDAEGGLAELRRVLKPGGALFASTFTTSALIGTQRRDGRSGAGFRVFELDELRGMLAGAGFEQVDVRQVGRACAICKARAPGGEPAPEAAPEA